MFTEHRVFRVSFWVMIVLILGLVTLIFQLERQINKIEAMNEFAGRNFAQSIEQNDKIKKVQREILDLYDNCAKQGKYLNSKTGECT